MGDLVPSGDPDLTVFIVITLVGFVVGVLGHIYKSTPVIITGIVLILAATIILPLIVFRGGS
jgi:hypothetical protein